MTDTSHLESRLENLEIKASYSEDLLDELNNTIFRQQQQIDRMAAQIGQLKEMIDRQASSAAGGATTRDPRDDIPPHY